MSQESAMRFLMLLERDSDLKGKYLSAFTEMEKLDEAEKGKLLEREILPMAKEAGFEFSIDELKEFQGAAKTGELSDEDLDKVVGGEGQMRYYGCVHCTKYEDPSYIKKSMDSNGFDYVCPSYQYHPHFGMTNRCDSCQWGYLS